MGDENQVLKPEEIAVKADEQIAAGMWDNKPAQGNNNNAGSGGDDEAAKKAAEEAAAAAKAAEKPVFDEAAYIKQHFELENLDAVKNYITELKTKAETPAEIKFANEQSKKMFDLINDPDPAKRYELGRALNEEYELEQAAKIEITDVKTAADIIKLNFKYKYKDSGMTGTEINDMFNDTYVKPDGPEQGRDELDAEFEVRKSKWVQQCENIDKRLIRDAKLAKPELSQFKSQIVFPDIPKQEAVNKQPTQEELDAAKKIADGFIQDAEASIKSLNEFSLTYKDEAVEIPLSYVFTAEEKAKVSEQVKAFVEKRYDANAILAHRWIENGVINVSRMTSDLLYLNNREKIEQKFVDDAVGKRMDAYTKSKKNISLDGGGHANNGNQDYTKGLEAVEEAIWNGKR